MTKGKVLVNLETPSRAVVRFYSKRGTAEQWIEEGKQAVKKMTRLSWVRPPLISRLKAHPIRLSE